MPNDTWSPDNPARAPEAPAQRYALGEVIGRGGMGTVVRAHDEVLGRDVACKLLDGPNEAQFHREARLTAAWTTRGSSPSTTPEPCSRTCSPDGRAGGSRRTTPRCGRSWGGWRSACSGRSRGCRRWSRPGWSSAGPRPNGSRSSATWRAPRRELQADRRPPGRAESVRGETGFRVVDGALLFDPPAGGPAR